MLKLENTEVLGWEHAIRGMRNPMNSWEKSDSYENYSVDYEKDEMTGEVTEIRFPYYRVGAGDLGLMTRLRNAGTDHRKFMRMITVYVDLTGPLYWWKEFDTYKVGTVANSCSTMHKIAAKEFTLEDFSHEHLFGPDDMLKYDERNDIEKDNALAAVNVDGNWCYFTPQGYVQMTCNILNHYREKYLETQDKQYWWQMIQLLPSSYNQRRTVMLNYEVLANIYKSRRNHKLDEWHTFCDWIEGLPYGELITGKTENTEDIEDSVDISHLVDITCSWDVEELGGERIYVIRPDFTHKDLTPYELYLLEKTEEYLKRAKIRRNDNGWTYYSR